MRTTLTLDPDVHRLLEEEMHRQRTSLKDLVNRTLRAALAAKHEGERFVVRPHASQLVPGIDPARMNQLVDELEVEEHLDDLRRGRPA